MNPAPRRRFRRRLIALWAVLAVIILLVAARIYLPFWLKDYVNAQLNGLAGYRGSVSDIDVHLYRGAYTIKGLVLNKIDKGIPAPFLTIATADISVQWAALLHGRIVSDIHLLRPELTFAVSTSGQTSQTGMETNWKPLLDNLVPIDINLVEIIRGKVSYRDFSARPPVNIFINELNGEVKNLRNVVDANTPLPSSLRISGHSLGGGKLGMEGRLNILTRYIDMDLDTRLEGAQLPAFNDFTRACCALDFKKGSIDIYSELAVKDGQIDGYVKPLVKHLSVDRIPQDSNPFEVLWAGFASVLLEVFQNQPRDQFATKVPLSGSLEHIETSIWPTLGGIFRNAFIKAFEKGTDGDVKFDPPAKQSAPQ